MIKTKHIEIKRKKNKQILLLNQNKLTSETRTNTNTHYLKQTLSIYIQKKQTNSKLIIKKIINFTY